ncbi:hypothetical protein HMPREF0742_01425 [Rothia aeria F0184]|uniref:Uncharacterized protein n=1 Tax=Rothia aeria F0184 TaxID=888019 RepID=U7V3B5_9MICC|nr:hypothetical protein HMPREF0742_01425 [Rothia aeria F0184]
MVAFFIGEKRFICMFYAGVQGRGETPAGAEKQGKSTGFWYRRY